MDRHNQLITHKHLNHIQPNFNENYTHIAHSESKLNNLLNINPNLYTILFELKKYIDNSYNGDCEQALEDLYLDINEYNNSLNICINYVKLMNIHFNFKFEKFASVSSSIKIKKYN